MYGDDTLCLEYVKGIPQGCNRYSDNRRKYALRNKSADGYPSLEKALQNPFVGEIAQTGGAVPDDVRVLRFVHGARSNHMYDQRTSLPSVQRYLVWFQRWPSRDRMIIKP